GEAGVDRVEPVLARVLLHALGGAAVAGVVHEGVELAEGLGPGLDHALHVGLGGGVPGDGDRPAAVGLDERGRLFHQAPCAPRADEATTMRVRTPAASHASTPSRTSAALPKSETSRSQRSDISSGMRPVSPAAMARWIASISAS